MITNKHESCRRGITDENKSIKSSCVCKVCGSKGAQMSYGAECCPSCKAFFRRNCDFDLNINQCIYNEQCEVTVNSRTECRYCRLKKCFFVGLQKEMIRSSHPQRNHSQKENQNKYVKTISHKKTNSLIPTINLLRNDQSLLTIQQWSFLSNVLNIYDENSTISVVRNNMDLLSTYPSKIRLKMAKENFEHISSLFYVNVGPLMHKVPEFKLLSKNDQIALIERNIRVVGNIGGTLVLRETDIYHNPYYYTGSVAVYGSRIIKQAMKIIDQADINGLLLKLCLPIFIFSTSADILNPSFTSNNHMNAAEHHLLSNPIHLFHIQSFYTEILFKYMLYQFGFKEAILRFFNLVKTGLDVISLIIPCDELEKYDDMLETIVKETQQTLILNSKDTL